MGACDYSVYVKGQGLETAFKAAVSEAQFEHGHGGYSGSIAEKAGYGCNRVDTAPLPLAAAEALASRLMEAEYDSEGVLRYTDKRGPANAIPVAPDSAFRMKHKTLYLNLKQEGYLDPLALAREGVRGKTICDATVLEDRKRTRIKKANGRKRQTVYAVLDRHNHVVAREDTMPAAKAKAISLCEANGGGYFIKGEIMDGGKAPLFGCVQEQLSRKVKLKVTYVEETRRTPAPVGWYFFGYASS